ncbi:MAG: 30S ribosomal protein S4 [Deltaproteobacteria bacterium]|nr:MAG: 30S ribosomal protein S4 [Deltaproteobacteria bacterium]
MARYLGSVCKLCRRERMKLFLKGERCYTDKCSVDRRPYPPGVHGQRRAKYSPYGEQLREKQKVKRMYGLLERQFKLNFLRASRMKGIKGENMLLLLERRLDNMVYRMGFARSRREARQLVRHGHFRVNGKKVDLPSYLLRVGDEVSVRDRSKKLQVIQDALEGVKRRGVPGWIKLDEKEMKAVVEAFPSREDLTMPIREHLIVEIYSK